MEIRLLEPITARRLDIATHLRRTLGADFVVVPAPDHPLVMRSVDVLAGGRSGLTAIMMSTAEELRRPKLFDARLKLNMMALPPHTAFVYVAVKGEIWRGRQEAFAAELSIEDHASREDLTRLATNPPKTRHLQKAERSQKHSEARFADTYRLARALRRGLRHRLAVDNVAVSRAPYRDRLPNEIEGAFFPSTPSSQAIANLALEGADRWYDIWDGEPEPRPSAAGAAFVQSYPMARGDPDKILRAAAFAGWVMMPLQTDRSFEELGALVQRYTRLK